MNEDEIKPGTKIKELPKGISLDLLRIKSPTGVIGYLKSYWGYPEPEAKAGVWLSDGESNRIYPQFLDDIEEVLEWEITNEPINCHEKTDMEYTNHCKS